MLLIYGILEKGRSFEHLPSKTIQSSFDDVAKILFEKYSLIWMDIAITNVYVLSLIRSQIQIWNNQNDTKLLQQLDMSLCFR